MSAASLPKPRSGCPVGISLDLLGDRWSLLIVRDMMVRGFSTFRQFQQSGEAIATNILSDRLHRLLAAGIVTAEADPADRRRVSYRLTEKGIALAPVLFDLLVWGARFEVTAAPAHLADHLESQRHELLAEVRRRWANRDSTPLLPKFESPNETSL